MTLSEQKTSKTSINPLRKDLVNIIFLMFLYFLQAIPLGLTGSLPYILSSHKVSYADQGTFSFAFWPFSLKLLWAPLVDSLFIAKFGKRKSWLIPTQYLLGFYMIYYSSIVNQIIENDRMENKNPNNIYLITCIFFAMSFLAATQDIVVDGWALTILSKENMSWSSTCESTGGTFGWFVGNVLFLVIESAEFSNSYIRPLFGLEAQSYGIVTLETFMKFFGFIFVVTTTLVLIFKKEEINGSNSDAQSYSLLETYKLVFKIATLPSILKLFFVLFSMRIAFSIEPLSFLKLIESGVPREKLGLLAVPLTPLQVLLPFTISKFVSHSNPFEYLGKAYFVRIVLSLVFAGWVFVSPTFKNADGYSLNFFLVCILLQAIHSTVLYSIHMPIMYFFTRISDKNIGATYLTFLNTISNLSNVRRFFFLKIKIFNYLKARSSINTASLFLANFLSIKYCSHDLKGMHLNGSLVQNVVALKQQNECSSKDGVLSCNESGGQCETYLDAYYLQTFVCFLFGLAWLIWLKKYLFQLQKLPESSWKIHLNKVKLN
ncbi:acetyl-coenzyme A transporter 1 [Brachionus plicatilis]|uniref:Acetyl-coenzyme A transporter 1 n=1 Tax=Brachionus plicatilis TaxID=10195 RepID=A0A3M7QS26_BRAPC|nr:acetyl-coenzyme A transporter 1 [Brachionus plicatilis]